MRWQWGDEQGLRHATALMSTAGIGRVLTTIGGLPTAIPVRFEVAHPDIVFTMVPELAVDLTKTRPVLGLQAEDIGPDRSVNWSVVVAGITRPLGPTDDDGLHRLADTKLGQPAAALRVEAVKIHRPIPSDRPRRTGEHKDR